MTPLISGQGLAGLAMKLLAEAKERTELLGRDLVQAPGEIHRLYAPASAPLPTC
jgi:hypothetical protein